MSMVVGNDRSDNDMFWKSSAKLQMSESSELKDQENDQVERDVMGCLRKGPRVVKEAVTKNR